MGRVNQLRQDAIEAAAEAYLAEHPDADPEDVYAAVDPQQAWHEQGDAMADRSADEAPELTPELAARAQISIGSKVVRPATGTVTQSAEGR